MRKGREGGERKFEAASFEPSSCLLLVLGTGVLVDCPDPPNIQKPNPMNKMPARTKVMGLVFRNGRADGIVKADT